MRRTSLTFALVVVLASAAIAENWPRFRGPTGQGVSQETNLPIRWAAQKNVAWMTPIPGLGWSSPIVWNDFVFVTTATDEGADCHIIALDRRTGDVTETHIAWEQRAGTPTQPSMLYITPYLYAVSDRGIVSCYESSSGGIVWRHRIGGNHCASPVYANGKIYTLSEEGETTVFEVGPKFRLISNNSLNEHCQASIAISQGNLFIRTKQRLYCVGPPPK